MRNSSRLLSVGLAVVLQLSFLGVASGDGVPQPWTLSGTVTQAAGGAAAGAQVRVFHHNAYLDIADSTTVDANGAYSLTLPASESATTVDVAVIPATADTSSAYTVHSVAADGTSKAGVDFTLATAGYRVIAKYAETSGIAAGALVRVRSETHTLVGAAFADINGLATISSAVSNGRATAYLDVVPPVGGNLWAVTTIANAGLALDLSVAQASPLVVSMLKGNLRGRIRGSADSDPNAKSYVNESTLADVTVTSVAYGYPLSQQTQLGTEFLARPDGTFAILTSVDVLATPVVPTYETVTVVAMPAAQDTLHAPSAELTSMASSATNVGDLVLEVANFSGTTSTISGASGRAALRLLGTNESKTVWVSNSTSPWSFRAHITYGATYTTSWGINSPGWYDDQFIGAGNLPSTQFVAPQSESHTATISIPDPSFSIKVQASGVDQPRALVQLWQGHTSNRSVSLGVANASGKLAFWLPASGGNDFAFSAIRLASGVWENVLTGTYSRESLTAGAAPRTFTVDVNNIAVISGRVLDVQGNPVPGAVISCIGRSPAGAIRISRVCVPTTGADGSFALTLPAVGRYWQSLKLVVDPRSTTLPLYSTDWLSMPNALSPVTGAVIQLPNPNMVFTFTAGGETLTQDSVEFSIYASASALEGIYLARAPRSDGKLLAYVPEGLTVSASASPSSETLTTNYGQGSSTFTVQAPYPISRTLNLPRIQVTGQVLGANGGAFTSANAMFRAYLQEYVPSSKYWTMSSSASAQVANNGSFLLAIAAAGKYRLFLSSLDGSLDYGMTTSSTCVLANSALNVTEPFSCDSEPSSPDFKSGRINWQVQLQPVNIFAKITNLPASIPQGAGWSVQSLQRWNAATNGWDNVSRPGFAQSGSTFVDRIDADGKYRYRIWVNGVSTLIPTYSPCIAVVSGKIEVLATCASTPAGTGVSTLGSSASPGLSFALDSAGVVGQLVNAAGETATFTAGTTWFNVMAQRYSAEKNSWISSNEWAPTSAQTATFQAALTNGAGVYRLWVYPTANSGYATTYSSNCVMVNAQGQMTDPYACGNPPGSPTYKSSITWIVTLKSPNVFSKITNFPGTWPNGAGRGASLQKWDSLKGNWMYVDKSIDVRDDGSFVDYVESGTAGVYRYYIYVSGVPGITAGYSPCFSVAGSGNIETLTSCTATPSGGGAATLGSLANPGFKFALPSPNVSGRLLFKGVPISNASVELRKTYATGGWEYIAGTNTDSAGRFNLSADGTESGTVYTIAARPPRDGSLQGASETLYEVRVTPSSSTRVDGGSMDTITLQAANVVGTVKMPDGSAVSLSNGSWVNVQLQKYDDSNGVWNWVRGISIDSTGSFQESVRVGGLYRFYIEPNAIAGVSTTQSVCFAVNGSYQVQALSDCKYAAAAADKWTDLVTLASRLSEPNFKGHVTYASSAVSASAAFYLVDEFGRETYLGSTRTDALGDFGFTLTSSGTFRVRIYAQEGEASGASISYLFSRSGSTVTSSETLTQTSGVWQMQIPTVNVTGYLRSADGTYLSSTNGKSACLQVQELDAYGNWLWRSTSSCTAADGSFRLIATDPGTLRLRVSLWGYPDYSSVSSATFTAAVGFHDTITVGSPSLRVSVKDMNGNQIPQSWMNVRDLASGQYLDGINIDATGFGAYKFTSNGTYELQVNPPWNVTTLGARNTYIATVTGNGETVTVAGASKDGNGRWVLALAAPNFQGAVTANGQAPTTAGWLQVQDGNGMWVQGTNIAQASGAYSMFLARPQSGTETYTVTLEPGESERSLGFSKRTYLVPVTSAGSVHVYSTDANGARAAEVVAISGSFSLSYAPATVRGTVVTLDSQTVRDAWVVPITNYGGEFWQFGTNSAANGSFGLALPDASYQLIARAPNNRNDVASSKVCTVGVEGGGLSETLTTCANSGGTVTLQLRQPNFTVHVVDEANNPMPNVWLWFNFGVSGTGRNTDANGNATFLIDPAEQVQIGKWDTSTVLDTYLWIMPNDVRYSARNLSSWKNPTLMPSVPLSSSSFASETVTVSLSQNNTTINVKKPDGTAASQGAWVELFQCKNVDCSWFDWLAGGNTNALGQVKFQVESSTAKYLLHLWPGGSGQSALSETWISSESATVGVAGRDGGGILGASLNGLIAKFQSPNVIGTVLDVTGGPNRNGWIQVEKCTDETGTACSWVTGTGLGWTGKFALALEPHGYYKITAYPGSSSSGTRATSPVFRVPAVGDTGTLITANSERQVDLNLTAGNVSGSVYRLDNTTKAVGVAVVAIQGGTRITAVTNASGDFSLELGQGTWTLKGIPADSGVLVGSTSITVGSPGAVVPNVHVVLGN